VRRPSKLIVVVPAILLTRGGAKVSLTLKGTSESETGLTDLSIESIMCELCCDCLLFSSALFFFRQGWKGKESGRQNTNETSGIPPFLQWGSSSVLIAGESHDTLMSSKI